MAKALLVVMTSPVEGREDEYNDWYTNDHLDDVLKAAGFHAAQRFRFEGSKLSRKPPAPYLAIYEIDAADRERAEELLLSSANTEAMPISDAMDPEGTSTWWFQSITDRVEASGAAT